MTLFSFLSRSSRNRKQRRAGKLTTCRHRPQSRVKLRVECLEDRIVPSGHGTDPYTLYTMGDAYTGAPGEDRETFMARYQPVDPALGPSSALPPSPLSPANLNDPGSPGPFPVTTEEYNLGNLAFRPTDSPWASSGIELIGEIKAPTDLG